MSALLEPLRRRIAALEADPDMRKGRLLDAAVRDAAVDWEAIFRVLKLRGRHRKRMRWRRLLVAGLIRRPFPRGGSQRRARAAPAPAQAQAPDAAPATDVDDLAEFSTDGVWRRFRRVFPVLAVYGAGFAPCPTMSLAVRPAPAGWDDLWRSGTPPPSVRDVGRLLGWPPTVLAVADSVVPLAQRLWPTKPWLEWATVVVVRHRAAVPYLRRAACLAHGFLRGGCPLAGVWEAILLPGRGRKSDGLPTAV